MSEKNSPETNRKPSMVGIHQETANKVRIEGIMDTIKRVESSFEKLDERIRDLEKWQWLSKGAIGFGIFLVPIIFKLLDKFF